MQLLRQVPETTQARQRTISGCYQKERRAKFIWITRSTSWGRTDVKTSVYVVAKEVSLNSLGLRITPATNGAAERLAQSFKQAIRKSALSPQAALNEFLMHYCRIPLNYSYSPSEALNGRQIRCRIDTLLPSPAHLAQKKQQVAKLTTKRYYTVGTACYALYCGPRRTQEPRCVPAVITKVYGPCSNNFPNIFTSMPINHHRTALRDLYVQVWTKMKEDMVVNPAVCLMFNGWTDKHHGRGYLGIRATYVTKVWELRLVTISCRPFESYSSQAIANNVQEEMKEFKELMDVKKMKIFTTHDGAKNMVKSSKVLRSNSFTHCEAHCLNLLLMTDGMDANEEVSALLRQCRSIVQSLHFKAHVIEDELLKLKDQKFIAELILFPQCMCYCLQQLILSAILMFLAYHFDIISSPHC
ncbi:hypothetical protein CAPTEDRAFT_214795 [Capitella teleta]|uniref:DUF659 domain-containing protein n=1 Tax=Capitella teleta TaxID=283909 RepID=R7UHM0_CAPTE|nr:hypothetical protein CAPTEDRAFT_214795 [Capitella teleta]|eukprot:ELU05553.1 hypothetical protein CAPTEDRAFT_214795 [Capitella teleta]